MQANKNLLIIALLFILPTIVSAQAEFAVKGTISYEYKVNNHKSEVWWDDDEDSEWRREFEENNPKFSTYYYDLTFTESKSLFKYKGRDETIKKMWNDDFMEDNIWFTDYTNQKINYQKYIFGRTLRMEDSMLNIKWSVFVDDTRDFAGFTCKKAVGKIYDSVYVFAYYTDEIIPSVGPMNFNGLPGAIMAISIPRMHISLVAKSFSPLVSEAAIVAPKKNKMSTRSEVLQTIIDNTKEWGRSSHKFIWKSFL